MITDDAIKAEILRQVTARGPDKTVCPSEVARAFGAQWRGLMPRVRAVAQGIDRVIATQRGQEVSPVDAVGPIRLALRSE